MAGAMREPLVSDEELPAVLRAMAREAWLAAAEHEHGFPFSEGQRLDVEASFAGWWRDRAEFNFNDLKALADGA
jgi:hypothetical protein